MGGDRVEGDARCGLLAATMGYRGAALSADVRLVAKHCLLDWVAVTSAGAGQPAVQLLLAQAGEEGGAGHATLVGQGKRATVRQAALINGTASHALDYDDVNMKMMGHATVAIMPAVLACCEQRGASGRQLIKAFVAGYEAACHAGLAVAPSHYARGFHATATIGTLGAAAACADLMELDEQQTGHALGIAATQASGLKSMFGTMCKPLHAGRASESGLLAAQLASRGFVSRSDAFECADGFALTHSDRLNAVSSGHEFRILDTLFKYHASCYVTHAMLLALGQILNSVPKLDHVNSVRVLVDRSADAVCNIARPRSGLEIKFSLRMLAAFAMHGVDTSDPESFKDDHLWRPELQRTSDRVSVQFKDGWPITKSAVEVALVDGRVLFAEVDTGVPEKDLDLQTSRLSAKAKRLLEARLGGREAQRLVEALLDVESFGDINELTALLR
jgi:2-methylcitrate dehydratase PrpD